MAIDIKKGKRSHCFILSSDKGLCVAVMHALDQLQDITDDLKDEMNVKDAPSGMIHCARSFANSISLSMRTSLANLGISMGVATSPDLIASAYEKLIDYEGRVAHIFDAYAGKESDGPMPLSYSDTLSISPRSFGAKIENNTLVLPSELEPVLKALRLNSAPELFGYIDAFPSTFARALNCATSDIGPAKDELRELLRGHVEDRVLNPPAQPHRVWGFSPPKG